MKPIIEKNIKTIKDINEAIGTDFLLADEVKHFHKFIISVVNNIIKIHFCYKSRTSFSLYKNRYYIYIYSNKQSEVEICFESKGKKLVIVSVQHVIWNS